jgi:branched-chain amino acid transport system ATP-binding protein
MSSPILRVESLVKRFGGLVALGGVDLAVEAGEFRAIIGPNGAGKSTFFNTMTGLLRPDSGRVAFEGRDITGEPPHRVARRGVARTFQITSVFHDLSALENVQVALLVHARRSWSMWSRARALGADRARDLLALVGLAASCCSSTSPPQAWRRRRGSRRSGWCIALPANSAFRASSPSTIWRWCSRWRRASR